MSALIGLELCHRFHVEMNDELFIRCIIGLKYQEMRNKSQEETAFLNGLVGLLNGALIDVDKLDYTVRDSYVTGYNSLAIDIDRLVSAYTLYRDTNGKYAVGYKKGALSVIENVIYANDLERRWIQNHPSVLYDGKLVEILLGRFDDWICHENEEPDVQTAFTKQALSSNGMPGLRLPLKLLNDADVLSYIKNEDASEMGAQYLDREKRLKPLWKTEAAFDFLYKKELTPNLLKCLQDDFRTLLDILQNANSCFLDEGALAYLTKLCDEDSRDSGVSSPCHRAKEICEIFQAFSKEKGLDFRFLVIQAKLFRSSYRKLETDAIMVELDTSFVPLVDVMSVRAKEAADNMNNEFFCVYTSQENLTHSPNLGKAFFPFLRQHYNRPEE